MKQVLENQDNLDLIEAEAVEIEADENGVRGVQVATGAIYSAKAVVVASGTYLNGLILLGELQYTSGPHGMKAACRLTDSLHRLGIETRRFKTGTPARISRKSVDFSGMEVQKGDAEVIPFSFLNIGKDLGVEQQDCYLTFTTEKTREIIMENLPQKPHVCRRR